MTNPENVLELIGAFRRSKTMFAAVKLGVFDLLAEGPLPASSVAVQLRANPDATERLLESCVGLGLLKEQAGSFSITPESRDYLTRDSPHSMCGYILFSNDILFRLWENLESAVQEGTHRWLQTFGSTGPIFDSFFADDMSMRTFIMGMHGYGMISSPSVAAAFDLSRFRHFADLGGATGHLTIAACECNPELRGTVLDFEKVLPIAREQIEKSPARERISTVAGDFFTGELPPADIYGLGRILHDWSPEKIRILLSRVYQALPAGGALLIAEKLLDDDKCGPIPALMQSLNMLICTEGKERTLGEYREILERAGFSRVEGRVTGKPVDAVIAYK